MSMKKLQTKILLAFALMLALMSTGECREVVFVLNAGQAMTQADPSHVAPESILWGMENLAAQDKTAIISYSEAPTVLRPLKSLADEPVHELEINYIGRSNTRAAVNLALDLLEPSHDGDRSVIVITDGDYPVDALSINRSLSIHVPIHILNLDINRDVMTSMRTLMHKNFRPSSIEFLTNATSHGKLPIELPELNAERLRVLLISSSTGNAKLLDAAHQTLTDGKFVKAYELERTDVKAFVFDVDYPPGTGLTVDIIAERNGIIIFPIEKLPWLLGAGAIAAIVLLSIPLVKRRTRENTDISIWKPGDEP